MLVGSPTRLEGMETRKDPHCFNFYGSSPTRLEGMETVTVAYNYSLALRSLRPALRGWKHFTVGILLRKRVESPTRLEGMETSSLFRVENVRHLSPTRLEGMETQHFNKPTLQPHQSPTRLEGMETWATRP